MKKKLPPGREPPPQGRAIPSTMTKVDLTTGEETTEPMHWNLMPPPAHCCQVCAVQHDPLEPHNAQSLYYGYAFNAAVGRAVTWADAVAHCDDVRRQAWRNALTERGHWTEPPAGVAPVKHLGGP